MAYIENPKTKGSGIIGCIPQSGLCPNQCPDCFFQSGRSYLEPLKDNLPNIPTPADARGRVVRMNDGNDSMNFPELVMQIAHQYDDYFYNTCNPQIDLLDAPVVLTVNPGTMTDSNFHRVIGKNLMFVRARANTWNLSLLREIVDFYTETETPIGLTYMAYYHDEVSDGYKQYYEWRKRTLNSYWCITNQGQRMIEAIFTDNPFVYSCGGKLQKSCRFCGMCLREYYATKERMRI